MTQQESAKIIKEILADFGNSGWLKEAETAFNMAISALESAPVWTPCSEGIPPINDDGSYKTVMATYITWNGEPDVVDAVYLEEYGEWFDASDENQRDLETVTAWMPTCTTMASLTGGARPILASACASGSSAAGMMATQTSRTCVAARPSRAGSTPMPASQRWRQCTPSSPTQPVAPPTIPTRRPSASRPPG